jgi:hypothetical protein
MMTMDAAKSVTATFTISSQNIPLTLGWNLVSFNLQPVDTSITTVLASLDGNYDLVYAWDATGAHSSSGNWMIYDTTVPPYVNTLHNLDETMGFWIRMTAVDTLVVGGTAPTATNISLSTVAGGWNLVGYPSVVNHILPDALSLHGVGTDFSLVYAYHGSDTADPWKMFDRTAPPYANDLLEMAPGWGYWVRISADHTWEVEY